MDYYETPAKGIVMIPLMFVAFLLGAYTNAYLARRKYHAKIRDLNNTNYVTQQSYYSRGYSDGYDMGKADETARQQNYINDVFMNHSTN